MGLWQDAKNIQKKDPAATSVVQVLLLYPGFHALIYHRVAHWLYRHRRFFLARTVSQWGRGFTGVEIHPGATIGHGLFIDHGAGVVIGETAEIGDNVTIYHGVTLGGTGKQQGKRHPTLQDGVLLGAGVKVLGPVVIGECSRIGANATVLTDIPPHSTAVGSPAVVVRQNGESTIASEELNQSDYPSIYDLLFSDLSMRMEGLENRLKELEGTETKADADPGEADSAAPPKV
ncbi:serine O-acetyltransferase [Ruminococcaceae bacterium OttesenSCG-928-D13]|nr:serine O-acetyltransferase [Ruminococcaceae bacterium OttesenSCG-928-D13]